MCCFAALGRDHHLALPAGASAFLGDFIESLVDSVGKISRPVAMPAAAVSLLFSWER